MAAWGVLWWQVSVTRWARGGGPSPSSCVLFPFWRGVVFIFDIQTLFSQLLNQALSV